MNVDPYISDLIEVLIKDDVVTVEVQNPWKSPESFDKMFTEELIKYNDAYVEAEIGGLKRVCQWAIDQGVSELKFNTSSILVCLENLQRYYNRKYKDKI
jgi:hypothetical protein